MLEQSSPYAKLIRAEAEMTRVDRSLDMQWLNPELNFEREHVGKNENEETEQAIYLSKEFSFPWIYRKKHHVWQLRLDAAAQDKKQELDQLLASARTEYTRLALLKNLASQHSMVKQVLEDLNQTVKTQKEEGAISALDQSLLSLSIFGLEAEILLMQDEYRHSMTKLKQILGINTTSEIVPSTKIDFIKLKIDHLNQLHQNHPGLRAHKIRINIHDQQIQLNKQQVLSSFSMEGGYKNVGLGNEGYVIGISLPLPILNRNKAQIESQKIQYRIQKTETALYEQKLLAEIYNLNTSIQANMNLLKEYAQDQQGLKLVEDLTLAYREGHLPLTGFLNAIQLYRESSKQYSDHLTTYYQEIFELETLYGQQLVTF